VVTNWEESGEKWWQFIQCNTVVAELRKKKRNPVGTANNQAKNALSMGHTN
jgi:hypothetical protein